MMNYNTGKTVNLSAFIQRISGFASLLISFTIIIATLVITPPVFASDLDEFETAATTDNSGQSSDDQEKKNEDQKKENKDQRHSFFSDLFGEIMRTIINSIVESIYDQAKLSFSRVEGLADDTSATVEIRAIGEPTLPFFELEPKYMYVNPEITAWDGRLEAGYGPFGFDIRNTCFTESLPHDSLTLTECHFLLRFSSSRSGEYGIGIGTIELRGNEANYGLSLCYPIKVYPHPSIGVNFTPTYNWINGNFIRDNDLALVFSKRYVSVKVGYRFLEVNGENLNGAYAGLAWHY